MASPPLFLSVSSFFSLVFCSLHFAALGGARARPKCPTQRYLYFPCSFFSRNSSFQSPLSATPSLVDFPVVCQNKLQQFHSGRVIRPKSVVIRKNRAVQGVAVRRTSHISIYSNCTAAYVISELSLSLIKLSLPKITFHMMQ